MKNRATIVGFVMGIFVLVCSFLAAGEIHDACQSGDLGKVKTLLSADPSLLQSVTPEGKSPLHMATGWGKTDIVSYLISVGADINALNNEGGKPIHVAASRNQPACAEILLKNGADIESARVNGGSTPLAIAVFKENLEVTEFLLQKGASADALINNRASIYQIAQKRSSEKMKQLLLKYKK